jgi:hypothetical protein
MVILLCACELGLEPFCCPPPRAGEGEEGTDTPQPFLESMDTGNPHKNVCIISPDTGLFVGV